MRKNVDGDELKLYVVFGFLCCIFPPTGIIMLIYLCFRN